MIPVEAYPAIGIACAVVGNLVISFALNIQRYAHLKLDRQQSGSHNYVKSKLWWLGALLMTTGEVGNFVAYGFAPASVVSPLGVITLISNCIIAPCFLDETLGQRNLIGVCLATLGILLIIISVQNESEFFSLSSGSAAGISQPSAPPTAHEAVIIAISQPSFQIYSFICIILIIILYSVLRYNRSNRLSRKLLLANLLLVALCGAYTALSTKAVSRMVNYSFIETIRDPLTYILLFILVSTAVVQIIYLNRALRNFDATQVIPVHFAFFTISVIIGSAITFHDLDNKDPGHLLLFFIGCMLTFIGVWLITSGNNDRNSSSNDSTFTSLSGDNATHITDTGSRPLLQFPRFNDTEISPVASTLRYEPLVIPAGASFLSVRFDSPIGRRHEQENAAENIASSTLPGHDLYSTFSLPHSYNPKNPSTTPPHQRASSWVPSSSPLSFSGSNLFLQTVLDTGRSLAKLTTHRSNQNLTAHSIHSTSCSISPLDSRDNIENTAHGPPSN